jgi:hypothetical protein
MAPSYMSLYSKYDYTQTIRNSQYIYNRAGLLSSQYIGHKLTPKLTISGLGLFVPARRAKTLQCNIVQSRRDAVRIVTVLRTLTHTAGSGDTDSGCVACQ